MQDKIKILFIIDQYYTSSGGTEGQLFNLITNLNKNIFYPELCVYRINSEYFNQNKFPCLVMNMNITSFRNPAVYPRFVRLRKYIRKGGFDIVQILFNDTAISVPLIAAGLKTKVVAMRRDMGFWYTPANLAILRFFAHMTDKYLVNSYAVKKNVMEKEGIPENKIEVIYNAHAMNRFETQPKPDFFTQYDIPVSSSIVGIVSNYRTIKRVHDLIGAFPAVLNKIKNAFLVIIGKPGVSKNEYQSLIDNLGIQGHVRMLGMVDNVIPYVKWFDIGINSSESEGLSNVIIEYMGCGVPVVATDISSNRELIENGDTGLFYPVGDIDALSAAIIRVLEDKQLANRLSTNSREWIRLQFDESVIVRQYEEFYIKLAHSSS